MVEPLSESARVPSSAGPVVLIVMDGVGVGPGDAADAVAQARTPTLDRLRVEAAYRELRAHGTAVGLPSDDDMGNSEVGHNALGAGRIIEQGARLVNKALESGALYESEAWREVARRAAAGGAIHFVGLLSDGNVHSHEDHLHAMLRRAHAEGFRTVYVHALLDGRDVSETSAPIYLERLESLLAELSSGGERRYRIASGGGRMKVTMDRYEADWSIVERGWRAHVQGEARRFASALAAVEAFRAETPGIIDQDLPAFVVEADGAPVGAMRDGDAVLLFNFRGDRAIELSRAFDEGEGFAAFDRGRRPEVFFAGMTLYDGDLGVPRHYLVAPPRIDRTMSEYLAASGVTQFAISETQKYGHVTYFWNGNRSEPSDPDTETWVEIPSDRVSFDERPWMKAAEITDRTLEALASGAHRFLRLNYANGDMVGHTGKLDATVLAVETVDLCLARLLPALARAGGTLVLTADHGNADDMVERDKGGAPKLKQDGQPRARTSHTLNPVGLWIWRPGSAPLALREDLPQAGLANVAATVLELLGFEPPADYEPSLLA